MWAVGTDICGDDIVAFRDPHSHIYRMSEWTFEGFKADLELSGNSNCICLIFQCLFRHFFGLLVGLFVCLFVWLVGFKYVKT